MSNDSKLLALLDGMSHSQVNNYIVPDVSSKLLGSDDGEHGRFRIFDSRRDQDMLVTPHNHRFNLWSMVIQGQVENTVYTPDRDNGDLYMQTSMRYNGEIGKYVRGSFQEKRYVKKINSYTAGSSYYMRFQDIHTIKFHKDTVLLIVEGKPIREINEILEPVTQDGTHIRTIPDETPAWQFCND